MVFRPPLPPTTSKWVKKVYTCVHGGSERKSRGNNIRVKRHMLYTGCPFRFAVVLIQDDGKWRLEPRGTTYRHNHQVSQATLKTYPSERGIADPNNSTAVQTLFSANTKRTAIYNFLVDYGENVTPKDVDNLVTRYKLRTALGNDNDGVAELVARFSAQDPFNMATVNESDHGHTGVISFTSALMRATYSRFPELVLVDCTHKTNTYNYQLCTFMIVDEHGRGQPVQHSLLETNSDWHMIRAL